MNSINSIQSKHRKSKGRDLENKFKSLSKEEQAEFLDYFWEAVGIGMKLKQQRKEQKVVAEIERFIQRSKDRG